MRVGQICQDRESDISGILIMVDLRVVDISGFDIILNMDELTAHRAVSNCDLRRVIIPDTVLELCKVAYAWSDVYVCGILGRNSFKGGGGGGGGGECKTRENSNFLKKGKIGISVKIRNFFRSHMTKRTSPLESSLEI